MLLKGLGFIQQLYKIGGYIKRRHFSCGDVFPDLNIPLKELNNEGVMEYLHGSPERCYLIQTLGDMSSCVTDIPIVIGDDEYRTERCSLHSAPYDHDLTVARYYLADDSLITKAIDVSIVAQKDWSRRSWDERMSIFETAANLMAGKYRQVLNAATMLGQAKTLYQAEIDAACELPDFLRLNNAYVTHLLQYKPISVSPSVTKNSFHLRGMEGFWAAISPFNFTAIGGNLAAAPALMGNAVIWKPSNTAILSNWVVYQIFREAGLPSGVINFVPADGPMFGNMITSCYHLAGINFTGSVPTFNTLWKQVGEKANFFRNYPRMVGELGGKNYHFIHNSADVASVIACTTRSAFEYSGQKCSACSRIFVPSSLATAVRDGIAQVMATLSLAHPTNLAAFTSAVIDHKAFARIAEYIEHARSCANIDIIAGGSYDDTIGYYVQPTFLITRDLNDRVMKEEIFGPVLSMFVYEDSDVEKMLQTVADQSEYALTGSIFASDAAFMTHAADVLRMSAGNMYLNDKSTGAVVGAQPFGGARHSGTNDKAGGPHYLLRFTNPLTVKQTFVPQHDTLYPHMDRPICR